MGAGARSSAATIAAKIGVAPLSMPVTLDETCCSASGNSDSGTASHTTPSSASVGHDVRGTGCRVAGTETMTSESEQDPHPRHHERFERIEALGDEVEARTPDQPGHRQRRPVARRQRAVLGPRRVRTRRQMRTRLLGSGGHAGCHDTGATAAVGGAGFGHLVPREHDDRDGRANAGRLLRSDDEIDGLLARTRSVAVVGVSGDAKRPSRRVAAYLIGATDWTVYLVNPNIDAALGRHVYPSLADLPEPPDLVDTFRRVEHLPAVVADRDRGRGGRGLVPARARRRRRRRERGGGRARRRPGPLSAGRALSLAARRIGSR